MIRAWFLLLLLLRSRCVLRDAYEISPENWYCGPWSGTRRRCECPRYWYGVSHEERAILCDFLCVLGVEPDELHTHVGVGRVPSCAGLDVPVSMRRVLVGRWPWRVDAAMKFGRAWWLVEVKYVADHKGIGQLAYYWWAWCRDCRCWPAERAVMVCRECDPEVRRFAADFGIDLVAVDVAGG